MRRMLILFIGLTLIISMCGQKTPTLEKDTPAYQLAKDLSAKIEYLDPDKDNVIIKSKNFELTVGEIIKQLYDGAGNRAEGLKQMETDQLKSYFKSVAERFGEQKLLLNAAKKKGITITDTQVDSLLQMQYQRSGGEERFQQMLNQSGVTIDYVKSDIRKNLLINDYLQQLSETDSEITEQQIQDYYNQDNIATVRHILLRTQGKNDSAKQELRNKMEDILKEAKGGADFADLANQYSEDPGSKEKGGLYKDFERGTMVKPFDEAVFSTPVGEISDIVETAYGYHIIKVLDRKKETKPLEEVRETIINKLENQQRSTNAQDHIEQLKEEVNFEVVEF